LAIPDLERKRAETILERFCERIPAAVRFQLCYAFTVRGNAITLVERRPHYKYPEITTEHPFARFVFDPASHTWSLRWRDRNTRFHEYEGFSRVQQFSDLVAEVERDPTHIFLG
jgi:Protein of unknown function (DUF3024)